jgi:hypothetical protein
MTLVPKLIRRYAMYWAGVEDPKAFIDALTASFRLISVQGHIEAQFVPRGYAVQADLGAVSGGQASLYRRALVLRTEIMRILDGLVSLSPDSDPQDMEAYRTLVRGAAERLVDEIGTAGGPRVEVVDNYFLSLTGTVKPQDYVTADTIAGQLGALRDRFGLIDANVNTVEEEGIRTSFWTLVDMVVDLQIAWAAQRVHFVGGAGQGFIGTELILLSRLMEATVDQVDEMEAIFDSVLINKAERRTLVINNSTQLTLDGLLLWLRTFLSDEGRRIAEDTGRDGIVAALAPTVLELFKTFKAFTDCLLHKTHDTHNGQQLVVTQFLPASCCSPLPAGLYAARSRIAVTSTCRLLKDLVKTAQRIGRSPAPVLTNVLIYPVEGRDNIFEFEFRAFNLRPTYLPAFIKLPAPQTGSGLSIDESGTKNLVLALQDSVTADDESMAGYFNKEDFTGQLGKVILPYLPGPGSCTSLPAEDLPIAVIDGELGKVIHAPEPLTYPNLRRANDPVHRPPPGWSPDEDPKLQRWARIKGADIFSNGLATSLNAPNPVYLANVDDDATTGAGSEGSTESGANPAGPEGSTTSSSTASTGAGGRQSQPQGGRRPAKKTTPKIR